MKKRLSLLTFLNIILFLPIIALAQVGGVGSSISFYSLGLSIVGQVWIVFTVIAVVMFVVAGVHFLTAQGDPGKIATARQAFLWGVAGIVVAILAYSIIDIVGNLIH